MPSALGWWTARRCSRCEVAPQGQAPEPARHALGSTRRDNVVGSFEGVSDMIKIFGHPVSTCTRKVLMTLNETKTPFELSVVDFATAEHKKAPHLARQPFGQIPAIDDDGFSFFESRAICRYINEKVDGALIPKDIKARALMEEWISVETSNFTPHIMKFIYHSVFQRAQEPAVLEAAAKGLETAVGVLDAQLAKTPFLAGSDFTLAEVCYMPYLEYGMLTAAKDVIAKHPHVAAWWSKIGARPAWQKTIGKA
jgi:glutathione S-transferase